MITEIWCTVRTEETTEAYNVKSLGNKMIYAGIWIYVNNKTAYKNPSTVSVLGFFGAHLRV